MYDVISKVGESKVQHGKYNNRVYLMKLSAGDFPGIINELEYIALSKEYTKIFAKVPEYAKEKFLENGYVMEASIPGFYGNNKSAYFFGKFITEERKHLLKPELARDVLETARSKSNINPVSYLGKDFKIELCRESDINEMTEVYRTVFKTYPFPIHSKKYIFNTMNQNITYFSIKHKGKIVSLSSAERDKESLSVEMTDFAILPEYRGKRFSLKLLTMMEHYVKKLNYRTSYTIARSYSYGMNITFSRNGYIYNGTLVQNTNISGKIESMNVWYKPL